MSNGIITSFVSRMQTLPIQAHAGEITLTSPSNLVSDAGAVITNLPALIQHHPNWFLTFLGLFCIAATIAVIEGLRAAFPEDCDPDGIDADDIR